MKARESRQEQRESEIENRLNDEKPSSGKAR
jgi:hypothetical protein